MSLLRDTHLWHFVRRTVTPLGIPCPGTPRLEPISADGRIDLHGDTIHRAYERVRNAVSEARGAGRRELVVVTGRSGGIRGEFMAWAALNPHVVAAEPLNGGGAYRVRLQA